MKNNIQNANGVDNSLQVSRLNDITGTNFKLDGDRPFLIKNITDSNVTCTVRLANMNTTVSTVFYPGWNPELVVEIVGEVTGLQYGN